MQSSAGTFAMSSEPADLSQASETALGSISRYFPDAVVDTVFYDRMFEVLNSAGFTRDNTVAIVITCPDEVSRYISSVFDKHYDHVFNLSGIGGIVTAGALETAASHSAVTDGKKKYVFFGATHLAVDENGIIEGQALREGQTKPSHACEAAFLALKNEIDSYNIPPDGSINDDNTDYGLWKKKLLQQNLGAKPTVVDLSRATAQIITSEIESYIAKFVDPAKSDSVLITGIQLDARRSVGAPSLLPSNQHDLLDYVSLGSSYHFNKHIGKFITHKETLSTEGKATTDDTSKQPIARGQVYTF